MFRSCCGYQKNQTKFTIVVGNKKSLFSSSCFISNINWLIDKYKFPLDVNCQIRYNGKISPTILLQKNGRVIAHFNEPQLAITPGQSIVFYDNNENLLGGGIIEIKWQII